MTAKKSGSRLISIGAKKIPRWEMHNKSKPRTRRILAESAASRQRVSGELAASWQRVGSELAATFLIVPPSTGWRH
jgi:hypothetical protein